MSLIHTAELRWFFEGNIPASFFRWFDGDLLGAPESRTDHYLLLAGWETVGIKLRGDAYDGISSFDVKAVKGAPEIIRLGDNLAGRMDVWVKWSADVEELTPWLTSLVAVDDWMTIGKKRWLRRFSLENDEPVEVPAEAMPNSGCSVELTQLSAGKSAYWSISFEAFGMVQNVRQILVACATWFVKQYPLPAPLGLTHSYAYPTWLNLLLLEPGNPHERPILG